MLIAQQRVMNNRALINTLFNGDAPMSEDESRKQNFKTNVNFLEATRIGQNAIRGITAAAGPARLAAE